MSPDIKIQSHFLGAGENAEYNEVWWDLYCIVYAFHGVA